ncbi:MAG: Rrf2 family transcriptional regulator [Bacteroidetes bacterium]|nr:Rrf2 family transcriptional regulator [Bacteroidota bacterium]
MRITTKGRYALRAIVHMVKYGSDKPISIRVLSEQTCISPEFLEQIFFRLRKADLITSTRGPGGGFAFTRSPSDVSIDDIFMAIDEGYFFTPCSAVEEQEIVDCDYSDDCTANEFWKHTYTVIRNYFASISIQNILDVKFPATLK